MEDASPLVSIITPVYNGERFLKDLIVSVMNQDYPRIEHIVIDDGSKDSSAEILKSYQDRYNLRLVSKPNEGQTKTLNRAIDMVKGDIVFWINADDAIFERDVISKVVKFFGENPSVDVAYGDMAIMDGDSRLLKVQYAFPRYSHNKLLRRHFAPFIAYRQQVLRKYRFDSDYDMVMDYEQSLRMSNDGVRCSYIGAILIAYRKHGGTKTQQKKTRMEEETRAIRKKYGAKLGLGFDLHRGFDSIQFYWVKLLGVPKVGDLLKKGSGFSPAFDLKLGSRKRLMLAQAIPFVDIAGKGQERA
jgi:glycosyltransferase involved in cell wall biosynthesis